MSVAQTSIENYHAHKRSGRLGAQAQQILDFLQQNWTQNWSRMEIAERLSLRLSSVCGRVNELVEAGLVEERAERPCSMTGKTIKPVRAARTHLKQN